MTDTDNPDLQRLLQRVRIVMVNTTHPGNIGSAARAMKTMGLSQLYLVDPADFPAAKATWMASGAADLLEHAQVVDTLADAIADCELVVATSARSRRIPWPVISPRRCGEMAIAHSSEQQNIAIVFGRESRGLTNEELRACNYHVSIDGNPVYPVLNIGAAIQVLCYEVRTAALAALEDNPADQAGADLMAVEYARWDEPMANAQEMEWFFEHLEQTLIDLDYLNPNHPKQIMTRARRLFMRSRLDKLELNMLRGVFAAAQKYVKAATEKN